MDIWGSNATWRLTNAQVKEILGQWADFDPLQAWRLPTSTCEIEDDCLLWSAFFLHA